MKKNTDFYDSLEQLGQHLKRDEDYRLRIFDIRSPITIIAPHGGFIEPGTSRIAQAIAAGDYNLFDFQGLRRRQAYKLHVTSTRFRHPYLLDLLGNSEMALSLHSMGKENNGTILVGGLNGDVKKKVMAALLAEGFPATVTGSRYRGVHPRNIVNLPPSRGVQIELTDRVIALMFKSKAQSARFQVYGTAGELSEYGLRFVAAVRGALGAGS